MNVKRPASPRTYASPLRAEQSDRTRERILDGLVGVMAGGIAELSIPAVARRAGVSVPTVYRHFSTKAELIAALAEHLGKRTRLWEMPKAATLGGIAREMYARHEGMEATLSAALASELGQRVRRDTMPKRLARIRAGVATIAPGLDDAQLDRLTRVVLILMSSATMRAFHDYLGMSLRDAAEDVAWALEHIERSLSKRRR